MRRADRIIVATAADSRVVAQRYGIDSGRITVIPNYVDTDRFRPLPDTTADRGRIAFVGRLEAQKNVEALVDALAGLPHLTLMMIGDGPLRQALEARASRQSVHVEFVGRVPHLQLPALLNQAELFVLPSHYEGNPKALVEAMACGVPVIGAATPGIKDLLIHRETGFLCGPSAADIRAAVLEVLNDAGLRARLRTGALQYVRTQCSLAIAAERERALLAGIQTA